MKHLWIQLVLLLGLLAGSETQANNQNFFDYLPKYRKMHNHFQIDKIEYRDKRTIVYFRQILSKNETIYLYSGNHPESWYMRTPPRTRGLEVQFKLLELRDVRVNNELKLASLTSVPEIEYELKRGDVLTYEIHFARVPNYIKMLDMIQGKDGDLDDERLNCFDIMIKTKDSPLLGDESSVQTLVSRLEASVDYVQPQKKPNSDAESNKKPEPNKTQNPNRPTVNRNTDPEPIDYRPRQLIRLEDLRCSERVILPHIQFKDNETEFSGRVKAMENVESLVNYLNKYPDSRIRLHGHTDVFGDDYRNLQLSRDRAQTVRQALIDQGIRAERIEVYYYGGRYPLPGNEKGSNENRRVEAEPMCASNTATPTPKPAPSGPQLKIKDDPLNR